jgi:hypothetical protein
VVDDKLGHSIYALDKPLLPGDSLILNFEVQFKPRGFRNSGLRSSGAGQAILENGTYFTGGALPVIGYQPLRELWSAEDRRKYNLPRQVTLPAPGDINPNVMARAAATFEATVGTNADQVAVAPGELRRTWRKAGRRYFQYVSDVPIIEQDVFFSADYAGTSRTVETRRHSGLPSPRTHGAPPAPAPQCTSISGLLLGAVRPLSFLLSANC